MPCGSLQCLILILGQLVSLYAFKVLIISSKTKKSVGFARQCGNPSHLNASSLSSHISLRGVKPRSQ